MFLPAALSFLLASFAGGAAQNKTTGGAFEVRKIARGVYAVIRREPFSLWFNPNTVFIVGRKSVTIVDANITAAHTREVLAALRGITKKPARYVVNTHWHEDHIIGNRVYREAFPDVKFIAHRSALVDLPTVGAQNRRSSLENGASFVRLLRSSVEKGRNLADQNLTQEERAGYASDAFLIESYLAEAPAFEIVLPDVPVDDRFEIDDGERKIEILHLGKAHTAADLVVYLPRERIVASGDLVVHPVPLVGSTSYPLDYAATLENLLKLDARVTVPGHGPVMRDAAYARLMIRLLNSIKEQTEAAFRRGETLEEMRRKIDLEEFRRAFAGASQHRALIFENYVFLPATAAAYRQLKEKNGL